MILGEKREFLMLAQTYNPKRDCIGGMALSEKEDGQRCWWDGGITRGIPKSEVPWANTSKDARFKIKQLATGLWTRYGNVVHAPDSWLDKLPPYTLDGELWAGRGQGTRQILAKIVRVLEPTERGWEKVSYDLFSMPSYQTVLKFGTINNPNFRKDITAECLDFARKQCLKRGVKYIEPMPFKNELLFLEEIVSKCDSSVVRLLKQEILPLKESDAILRMHERLNEILDNGGEGLMLRNINYYWVPKRTSNLLKLKPEYDSEGTVTGYTTGRETDRGSKLLGKMGALILDFQGQRLELSGFTDAERVLNGTISNVIAEEAEKWARENPGKDVPDAIQNPLFPRGTVVTFKYYGLTKDGLPDGARYWRKTEEE